MVFLLHVRTENTEKNYLIICANIQIPKISTHRFDQNPNFVTVFTLDEMDEHILQYSSDLHLPSSDIQGTHSYVPYLAENIFSQQQLVKPEDCDEYSLPQWTEYQHLAPNYVDYLLGNDISNMQGDIPYENTGIGCSFTPHVSFLNMDAPLAEPNPYARPSKKPHDEVCVSNYNQTEHKMCYQQVPHKVVQHQPNMVASKSEIPTKSRKSNLRSKATESDRRRRTRIAAALDALDHLLPQSNEGSKTNVIDECMDYIKYLQLHMRELSQNRLGGEPTSSCLLHLEGFGSYFINENTATGPLQDMLGRLLEVNPLEAAKFLESRGLFVMPIAPN